MSLLQEQKKEPEHLQTVNKSDNSSDKVIKIVTIFRLEFVTAWKKPPRNLTKNRHMPLSDIKSSSTKSVQELQEIKMFSLAISETTVGLSLSRYRWKALPEQNINT